ncbi:uncharacterized protein NPIL_595062 [Nephila pilipes]|uniref:Uncharacterized protein n=1 Tax=Nephila pilipes TaxID=299642 RepID=A0A8X6PQX0_NEPPI|nr:uncharacterized protein NPIL_595062 [Nephila pilipes]
MIPEPDYSDSETDGGESEDRHSDYDSEGDSRSTKVAKQRLRFETKTQNEDEGTRRRIPTQTKEGEYYPKTRGDIPSRPKKPLVTEEELIKPKKPSNPYLESTERQKLHKELKFNQKYGKQYGSKRTELQMALERYTEGKVKKDLAASRRSSLEKILEQQARKIEKQEQDGTMNERPAWIGHLQRQHFTKRTDPKTDEFYRVHAKVVSSLMNNCPSNDEDQSSSDMSSRRSSSPSESSD